MAAEVNRVLPVEVVGDRQDPLHDNRRRWPDLDIPVEELGRASWIGARDPGRSEPLKLTQPKGHLRVAVRIRWNGLKSVLNAKPTRKTMAAAASARWAGTRGKQALPWSGRQRSGKE